MNLFPSPTRRRVLKRLGELQKENLLFEDIKKAMTRKDTAGYFDAQTKQSHNNEIINELMKILK